MQVTINNKTVEVNEGTTLGNLMEMQGIPAAGVAAAVNGKVIPAATRAHHVLTDGDNIVIIKAFYGG